MTIPFQKGRYVTRFAAGQADVTACQRLRHACFFGGAGADQDRFDPICRHLMVEDGAGRLVAVARLLDIASGAQIDTCYAAQFYDLSRLAKIPAPMIEVGRFCVAPDVLNADVLRVAWGALTRVVDTQGIAMLFGCSSFAGTDPAPYGKVFGRLVGKHTGPCDLRPLPKARDIIPFADVPPQGANPMPPLLRTYLAMGGWVSDHAVVDHAMNTLHVFTCLDVASVPPARAAALRALAQAAPLT